MVNHFFPTMQSPERTNHAKILLTATVDIHANSAADIKF